MFDRFHKRKLAGGLSLVSLASERTMNHYLKPTSFPKAVQYEGGDDLMHSKSKLQL